MTFYFAERFGVVRAHAAGERRQAAEAEGVLHAAGLGRRRVVAEVLRSSEFDLYLTCAENLYLDLSSLGRFSDENNRGWGDRRRRGRGRRGGGKEAGGGRGKFGL